MENKRRGVIARTYPFFKKNIWFFCMLMMSLASMLLPQIPQLIIDRIVNPALGSEPVYSDSNVFSWLIAGYAADDYAGMLAVMLIAMAVMLLVKYLSHYLRFYRDMSKKLELPVKLSFNAPHDDKGRKQSARLCVRAHAAPESARARELYGRRPSERDQQRPYGNQRLVRPFCAVPARFDSVDAAGDVLSGANQSAFGGNPRDYGYSHGVPRARL